MAGRRGCHLPRLGHPGALCPTTQRANLRHYGRACTPASVGYEEQAAEARDLLRVPKCRLMVRRQWW